jgi:hypothetical protein
MTDLEAEARRLALAHQLLDVCRSEAWQKVIVPYFEGEQRVLIANMASQTEALQLMRYAGSLQTFQSLIQLESTVRNLISTASEGKLAKFRN